MLVKSHRLAVKFTLLSSIRTGNFNAHFVPSVNNLGVTLDCNLNVTQHALNTCRSTFSQLRQVIIQGSSNSNTHPRFISLSGFRPEMILCDWQNVQLQFLRNWLVCGPQYFINRLKKEKKKKKGEGERRRKKVENTTVRLIYNLCGLPADLSTDEWFAIVLAECCRMPRKVRGIITVH